MGFETQNIPVLNKVPVGGKNTIQNPFSCLLIRKLFCVKQIMLRIDSSDSVIIRENKPISALYSAKDIVQGAQVCQFQDEVAMKLATIALTHDFL